MLDALEAADPLLELDALRGRFPDAAIILTLGARGARYADANERTSAAAPRVDSVDTTGAGDTFTGYFLAARAGGASPAASLQEACRAAALSTTKPGAGRRSGTACA